MRATASQQLMFTPGLKLGTASTVLRF
jgi:hypothetical protein